MHQPDLDRKNCIYAFLQRIDSVTTWLGDS